MKNLERVNGLCERVEKFIVSWGTITMAVVSIINVLSRNIFHVSFSWVEEISQFSVVLVIFVGTAYAARMGFYIRMTVLSDIMGYRGRKFLVLLTSLWLPPAAVPCYVRSGLPLSGSRCAKPYPISAGR